VTPHTRWSQPCVSATAFINSKNCSGLQFPFSAHRITSHLNFAVYDSLLDFWRPSSISTVHDKLEQLPSTFQQLSRELVSYEIAQSCWESPASRYWYDSSAPGVASDFNTLVTSNIIQSVALWAGGRGQLKERCGLEPRTNFFLFKKSPKTEC
jgi:hypothetical protein